MILDAITRLLIGLGEAIVKLITFFFHSWKRVMILIFILLVITFRIAPEWTKGVMASFMEAAGGVISNLLYGVFGIVSPLLTMAFTLAILGVSLGFLLGKIKVAFFKPPKKEKDH